MNPSARNRSRPAKCSKSSIVFCGTKVNGQVPVQVFYTIKNKKAASLIKLAGRLSVCSALSEGRVSVNRRCVQPLHGVQRHRGIDEEE